jgi:hypothetical protein
LKKTVLTARVFLKRSLAKFFFATHLPRAQVPGESTEKVSFKSFFSKVSVRSVVVLPTYAGGLKYEIEPVRKLLS